MNKKMINKKSAMFGLDARIALAIFGALSVIAGAALLSAKEKALNIALINDLNEIAKAFESLWLDTGSTPLRISAIKTSNSYHILTAVDLISDNGQKGWKGPYLNYENYINNYDLVFPGLKYVGFRSVKSDFTNTINSYWFDEICKSGDKCQLMIILGDSISNAKFHALDKIVDSGDGFLAGKLRGRGIGDNNDSYGLIYYFPGINLPNPL